MHDISALFVKVAILLSVLHGLGNRLHMQLEIAKYVYHLRVVCIALYIVCTFDIVNFVRIKSIFFMNLGISRFQVRIVCIV